jgi:hypothetical protein
MHYILHPAAERRPMIAPVRDASYRGQTAARDAAAPGQGEIMGLDDITKKAQEFLADDKVKHALHSEQAEDASDKILGAVADAASNVTGGKFDEQIDGARDAADKGVGTD